jgi:membrane-associated phospholipid phosphatase
VSSAGAQERRALLPDAPSSSGGASSGDTAEEDASLRVLPRKILLDQKGIWLFPVQIARGRNWLPTAAVVGGTAALIVADPHVMPYFRTHARNLDDINDTFDSSIASAEIVLAPLSIYLGGVIRHDPYAKATGLLAGRAFVDSEILDVALKAVTRRQRPSDVAPGAPFNDTFFTRGKSPLSDSSFPSGHAIGAFSIATVIARRYPQHRWLPFAAYGIATAVSLSRVTTSAHFPSDVFLGATLGYSIARFQVLRPEF